MRRYRKAFKREPGVWGVFTYDSARILFAGDREGRWHRLRAPAEEAEAHEGIPRARRARPRSTRRPATAMKLPFLNILSVDAAKHFVIAP